MKTHPHLLVRDALSAAFVAAAAGDPEALEQVRALARWAEGGGAPAALTRIRTEDGGLLFEPNGRLAERYAALEAHVRDRARRFAAACEWLSQEGSASDPLERARAAWDAGLFFEVHEILEPAWLEERGARRELLQGLIQAGAALHHLTRGNLAGARGLLAEAARRLAAASDEEPYDFGSFAQGLVRLRESIEGGHIGNVDEMREVPRLKRVARAGRTRRGA